MVALDGDSHAYVLLLHLAHSDKLVSFMAAS